MQSAQEDLLANDESLLIFEEKIYCGRTSSIYKCKKPPCFWFSRSRQEPIGCSDLSENGMNNPNFPLILPERHEIGKRR